MNEMKIDSVSEEETTHSICLAESVLNRLFPQHQMERSVMSGKMGRRRYVVTEWSE